METISVSQLNGYIKRIFENEELLHNIAVIGEVFGVSTSRQITYFFLKDEESTLPCVCFYPNIASEIKEGAKIVAVGNPTFYSKGGKFSFNVIRLESQGQGDLYSQFLKLKEKLENEGLFAASHKKPMPKTINRIGVITSREGAVIQDIKNVAWRRNPNVDIVLYSTKVQGSHAELEIAKAIEDMDSFANVDVIVVARGGGSLEDLAAYNTEIVARATYNCNKPIVSAVGHETDFTIIDFVSDLRAPTPSAAAELLTYNLQTTKEEFLKLVKNFISRMIDYYNARQTQEIFNLSRCTQAINNSYLEKLRKFNIQKLKFCQNTEKYYDECAYKLGLNETILNKLNPKTILKQGYAKIEQNEIGIANTSQINYDNHLNIIFYDGEIKAKPLKEEL